MADTKRSQSYAIVESTISIVEDITFCVDRIICCICLHSVTSFNSIIVLFFLISHLLHMLSFILRDACHMPPQELKYVCVVEKLAIFVQACVVPVLGYFGTSSRATLVLLELALLFTNMYHLCPMIWRLAKEPVALTSNHATPTATDLDMKMFEDDLAGDHGEVTEEDEWSADDSGIEELIEQDQVTMTGDEQLYEASVRVTSLEKELAECHASKNELEAKMSELLVDSKTRIGVLEAAVFGLRRDVTVECAMADQLQNLLGDRLQNEIEMEETTSKIHHERLIAASLRSDQLEKLLAESQASKKELEAQTSQLRELLFASVARADQLLISWRRAEESNQAWQKSNAELEEQVNQLKASLYSEQERVDHVQKCLDESVEHERKLDEQNSHLHAALCSASTQADQLQNLLDESKAKGVKLEEENNALSAKLCVVSTQADHHQQLLTILEETMNEMEIEKNVFHSKMCIAAAKAEHLQTLLTNYEAARVSLEDEKNDLSTKLHIANESAELYRKLLHQYY